MPDKTTSARSDHHIIEIAMNSQLKDFAWRNRGRAPTGYIVGMSVAFAQACRDLSAHDRWVATIATPRRRYAAHDVLDWYNDRLDTAGLQTTSASARLLAVFAILLGLGMRESSGKHCEGRDLNANNVRAETAEAGLFQVSYDSISAQPQLQELFDAFRGRDDLVELFGRGVRCSKASWRDWGEGTGREFESLTKQCPKFAVLYAGILLRHAKDHWGPIRRREAELPRASIALLGAVQRQVDQEQLPRR